MSTGKEISAPGGNTATAVASYGPSADFYRAKTEEIAVKVAAAMQKGDLAAANELYQRGMFAESNYHWNRKLAQCVGPQFTQMREAPWT
jgi:hypothetical protein